MAKQITRIVLTGGPAAGKTTLISRILKEFKQDEGWKVITIPETATELISGFGIKPFGGCVSMLDFQDFVVSDQLHKEQLALKAAQMVPEEHVIVLYDRALFDDKAYISDEEFRQVLARFGLTEQQARQSMEAAQAQHGDITWFDGVTDQHYENGRYYKLTPQPPEITMIDLTGYNEPQEEE